MVLITATFVKDTGWATGLQPQIDIIKQDGTEIVSNGIMSEIGNGNYYYDFSDYDKNTLYYYNIDANDENVSNRYQTANNELDYYNNKIDWGSQFRGAIGGFSENFTKRMNELIKLLEEYKPKKIDFSEILDILNELKNKEISIPDYSEKLDTIQYELENKQTQKNDYTDIIKALKNSELNLKKNNDENGKVITNLMDQIKSYKDIIKKLEYYLDVLIKRGDIEKDKDFVELAKEIKSIKDEEKKLISSLALQIDDDFISIIKLGLSE